MKGCAGCEAIRRRLDNRNHSEECRSRIQDQLSKTSKGREILQNSRARMEGNHTADDDDAMDDDDNSNIHSEATSGCLTPTGGGGEIPTVHEVRTFIAELVSSNDPSNIKFEDFNKVAAEKWPHFSATAWDRLHLMLSREIADPGWVLRSAPTKGQVHDFAKRLVQER